MVQKIFSPLKYVNEVQNLKSFPEKRIKIINKLKKKFHITKSNFNEVDIHITTEEKDGEYIILTQI